MASETVDPIDWSLPPTLRRAVPPELHLYDANAATNTRLLHPVGHEHSTIGMPGQRTTYQATQGIIRAPFDSMHPVFFSSDVVYTRDHLYLIKINVDSFKYLMCCES